MSSRRLVAAGVALALRDETGGLASAAPGEAPNSVRALLPGVAVDSARRQATRAARSPPVAQESRTVHFRRAESPVLDHRAWMFADERQ